MDDVRLPDGTTIPAGDLELRATRSGGPGGQSVNTSATKIELRFHVGGCGALSRRQKRLLRKRLGNRITKDDVLVLQSSEHRTQHRNREAALARFAALVGEAIQPRPRRIPTRPPRSADEQRLADKRHRGRIKRLRQSPEPPPE